MNHGMNMMREHIEPTARIHYVIPSGVEAPNVVPEYARVWYYIREINREKVERNYAWALDIAAGAALATQTDHKVLLITGVHAMLLNRPLQEAAQRNLEMVGPPAYNEEEQTFARELQGSLEIEQKGLSTSIHPLAGEQEPAEGGSTDVAEVSWITPTVSVTVASAGEGLPWHSWATSASHGTPGAARGGTARASERPRRTWNVSGQELVHQIAVDVGEAVVAALVLEGQLLVVNSQAVDHRKAGTE